MGKNFEDRFENHPLGMFQVDTEITYFLDELTKAVDNSYDFTTGIFKTQAFEERARALTTPALREKFQATYKMIAEWGEGTLDGFVRGILVPWEMGYDQRGIQLKYTVRGKCLQDPNHPKNQSTAPLTRQEFDLYRGADETLAVLKAPACQTCDEQQMPVFSALEYVLPSQKQHERLFKRLIELPDNEQVGTQAYQRIVQEASGIRHELRTLDALTNIYSITTRVKSRESLASKVADKITRLDARLGREKKQDTIAPQALKDAYGAIVIVPDLRAMRGLVGHLRHQKSKGRLDILGKDKDYWREPKIGARGKILFQGYKMVVYHNQVPIEIQIMDERMYDMSQEDHEFYRERKNKEARELEKMGIPHKTITKIIEELLPTPTTIQRV